MSGPNPAYASSKAQKWLRIAIVAIGAVTILCFLALSPVLRSLTKQDRETAQRRTGTGVIEQIVPPHLEENAKPTPAQVSVRVDGVLAAAETVFGSSQLHVGDRARVVYRIGRSGRVYVDSVEPEPRADGSRK